MKKLLIIIAPVLFSFICNAQCEAYGVVNGAKGPNINCKCDRCIKYKPDTIPSTILISHKAPSFGHSVDGYCLYRNGACTGNHFKYWHKQLIIIGPEYTIWSCKRRAK